jgi:hypothetical protein
MANRTEEILNSLDGMERAKADPYLYSKIVNRLSQPEKQVIRLAWNIALALLIIAALNIFTVISFKHKATEINKAAVIASDYEISLPAYY